MRKSFYLILSLVLVLGLTSCAKRSTEWQEPEVLELLHQFPIVGDPSELAVDEDFIYVAADQGGLSIIDRQNGTVDWYTEINEATGGTKKLYRTRRISVVSQYDRLFINETDGADTIYIIDIADPDSLKLIDGLTGATQDINDMRMHVVENPSDGYVIELAFTAGRNFQHGYYNTNLWEGFDFDIYPPATAEGYDMNNEYIYIAAQQRGLLIYNKATQQMVGQLALPGEARKVRITGNYAYVAGRQAGVSVVDISNPADPVLINTWNTVGYASTVDIHGNLAAVSSNSGGIYLFDITVPASPVLLQTLSSAGYTNNAILDGDQLIVASRDQGVLVYKIK